ncbi:HlyD family efflux transporter periplasmic adaptor subunit [Alkaliphilus peptidifermentans]|uniref:Putative membrane fusion protein n=1 Tax=Alkaliphilus peptidifermentans DSM 18978 TaxID=1120976 RepID=A0A1G5BAP5_9FIRM|nr:HlyD family efflux transporter periplasmic adaptor subunit [Alkaliphilus peptidifermentans]SCX87187.1 putative membrane fusion protein [Alkaliphilus peptidifermentans DSM 18978]
MQKKKQKKIKKVLFRIVIISIISLYFLSRFFPTIGSSSYQTYVTEYGTIEEIIPITGILAREEKIYTSFGEGEVRYFVTSGEKVAKGQKLAEVYLENLDEKTVEELEIVNLRIKNIQSKQEEGSIFNKDIDNIEKDIKTIMKLLQKEIDEGTYSNVSKYESILQELAEKKNIIAGEDSFSGRNLNQLLEEKRALEERVKSDLQVIYSNSAGFVAFGSDGLEDLITLKSIEKISISDLELFKKAKLDIEEEDIKMGTPVIRMVTNHRWSIFCQLETEQLENLVEGRQYYFRKHEDERLYKAVLRKTVLEDEGGIAIFDLSEAMEGYLDERTMQIDLITQHYEGVIIPNSAIVNIEGREGVYRIDVNGFVRFIPIQVKGKNHEFSVVHNGTFQEVNKESNETKRVNTINMYDEILLIGDKAIDGQKIR